MLTPVMVYFFFFIRRMVRFWFHPQWKWWHTAAIILVCVILGILSSNMFHSGIVVVMHLFLLCLATDLLHLVLRHPLRNSRWPKLYRSGLLPIAATVLVLAFAYWNMHHVVQKDYTIQTQKEIRAEGYQIVYISDLHFGISIDLETLQEYAKKIAAQQPDMVLLGGDIVDEGTQLEALQVALQILGDIPSEFGTYYVYGNHDRSSSWGESDYTTAQLDQAMADAGIHVLSDETVQLTEDLVLVGREDAAFSGKRERAQSAKLLAGIDPSDFILMLDHQPLDLEINKNLGVDLQLSGHTHDGQIWPIGQISTIFGINELTYGYRQIEDYQIIVSSGMAGWGYPFRTSGHSEYLMVHLQGQ